MARAMRTGSLAPAMPVLSSTPAAPSSMAMVTSDAVPTPASMMIGTVARSMMISMLLRLMTPSPEPMGAPAGLTPAPAARWARGVLGGEAAGGVGQQLVLRPDPVEQALARAAVVELRAPHRHRHHVAAGRSEERRV